MLMRALLCGLALCCILSVAVAQDEAITLRYKFTPDQTDTYQMTSTGTIPIDLTPGPEAGFPAMAMDLTLDMDMTMTQACRTVTLEGDAQLDVQYPTMTVHTSMHAADQPVEVLMTWDQGVLKTTVNGAEQPADENQKKMAAVLGAVLKMTMTPTGKSTPEAETAKLINDLMSASGGLTVDYTRLSALTSALPDHPVKIGDTWGVQDAAQIGDATLAGTSTLKLVALEDFEGVPTARVEGEAQLTLSGEMPPSSPMGIPVQTNITRLDLSMSFVNHFDIAKGNLLLSTMDVNQNMAMMISMGQGGAQQIHIPATIENAQMSFEVRRQ